MLVGEVTGAEGTQGTLGTPVSLPGEIRAAPPGSLTSCPYPDESAVRQSQNLQEFGLNERAGALEFPGLRDSPERILVGT